MGVMNLCSLPTVLSWLALISHFPTPTKLLIQGPDFFERFVHLYLRQVEAPVRTMRGYSGYNEHTKSTYISPITTKLTVANQPLCEL